MNINPLRRKPWTLGLALALATLSVLLACSTTPGASPYQQSPQFRDGRFHNLVPDAERSVVDGVRIWVGYFFNKSANTLLDNRYSTITSGGALQINGQANVSDGSTAPQVNNVGQMLYATETFTNTSYARAGYSKGSWTRPSVTEVVGDLKGIISGNQSVSIQGSVDNVNSGKTPTNVNAFAVAAKSTVALSLVPTVLNQAQSTSVSTHSVAASLPPLKLPTQCDQSRCNRRSARNHQKSPRSLRNHRCPDR